MLDAALNTRPAWRAFLDRYPDYLATRRLDQLRAEDLDPCFTRCRDQVACDDLRCCLADRPTGAVRVSLGVVSNFVDVERFVEFARTFLDVSGAAQDEASVFANRS
jgi:hypothetical protein